MQEESSATFQPMKKDQFADQEQMIKCPRCESTNTKFCYYNNYNLSQPRHFCKNCRRYWTKGGSLRNIPVGGGSRKNSKRAASDNSSNNNNLNNAKRSSSAASSSSSSSSHSVSALAPYNNSVMEPEQAHVYSSSSSSSIMGIVPESFTSLLGTNGHFGPILEEVEEEGLSLNSNGSGLKMVQFGEFAENLRLDCGQVPEMELLQRTSNNNNSESYLDLQNGWNNQNGGGGSGGNGWPDLSIYTPGSSFL